MKALPIALFVVAVLFAFIEWEHGSVHEAALENVDARVKSIQIPGERPVPQTAIRKIEPGPFHIAHVGPRVPVSGGRTVPGRVGTSTPAPPSTSVNDQLAAAKAEQAEENQTVAASHSSILNMRVILTILFIPACFFIILAKTRFDGKDRGFAYTTLGAILTFWLHS